MEQSFSNMDLFLNELMRLGGVGVAVMLMIGVIYGVAVASAHKNVERVEPEPGDRVRIMPVADECSTCDGVGWIQDKDNGEWNVCQECIDWLEPANYHGVK